MNAIHFLSSQPWVERLGWTLVHFLWQGVLIAALYAVTRRWILRSCGPNARYLLACATLATMLAVPLVTLGVLQPAYAAPASAKRIGPIATAAPDVAVTIPAPAHATVSTELQGRFLPWVVGFWLLGAIALWVRLIGSWVVAAGMRSRQVRPAQQEWQQTLGSLGARIGLSRPVRLLVSAAVQVPTVVGWIRPVVLMPIGALTGLPPEQVEALLLHELAHIRRHDYLVNLLQGVAEALLFYHPAVWWVSGHIRTERELCCDDVAVSVSGDVLTYARALAELESFRPAHLKTAIAANGGSLGSRIGRLLGQQQPVPASRTSGGPGVILSAVLTIATVSVVFVMLFSAFTAEAQTTAQQQARDQLNQGVRAFRDGHYETAVNYFRQAAELDADLQTAKIYLATAYAQQFIPNGRGEDNAKYAQLAIQTFDDVLKGDPNNLIAVSGLASLYQNMQELQKAHDYYLRVEQLDPLKPASFYAVGSLDWIMAYDKTNPQPPEEKTRLIEEGLKHLDFALAMNPDYTDAMIYKNLLFREKAALASDPAEKKRLTDEADQWFNKSLETRKKNQNSANPPAPGVLGPPSPPPPPPQPTPVQRSGLPNGAAIGRIEVRGNRAISTEAITARIQTKVGDKVNTAAIERDVSSVRSLGFEDVRATVEDRASGGDIIVFQVWEKFP